MATNKKFTFFDLSEDIFENKNELNSNKINIPKKEIIENTQKEINDEFKESNYPNHDRNIYDNNKKINNTESSNIENLLNKKNDKLDVKTNIYLKRHIYEKIEDIHDRTGKSRSYIINILLEECLKKM